MNQRKKKSKNADWESKKLFLLILPFLILCFLFSYFPLHGWVYALYDYRAPLKLSQCEFVGLKWFQTLFNNPTQVSQLITVMKNTFAMSLLGIATSFLPVLFAIFLNEIKSKKFRNVVQTLTTLPNFISWTLVYSVAFCLFSTTGMFNTVMQNLGILSEPVKILDSSSHVCVHLHAAESYIIFFFVILTIQKSVRKRQTVCASDAARAVPFIHDNRKKSIAERRNV